MTVAACRERLIDFAEPVLVLEMRRFRRRGLALVLTFAALIALLIPAVLICCRPDPGTARMVLEGIAGVYSFLILIVIPAYGARTISRERETGVWDMIAMTLLKSSRIADQRIVAAATPMLILLAAGLPVAFTLALFGGAPVLELASLGIVLVLTVLATSAWSVEASSDCGASATAVAYLPLLVHLCGCLAILACGVGLVVLLASPTRQGQAGRLFWGGLCILIGSGVEQYLVTSTFFRAIMLRVPDFRQFWSEYLPQWAVVFLTLGVGVLALFGLRSVLVRSIERSRCT